MAGSRSKSSKSKSSKKGPPDFGKSWVKIKYQFMDLAIDKELIRLAKANGSGKLASSFLSSKDFVRNLVFNKFKSTKHMETFVELAKELLQDWKKAVKKDYSYLFPEAKKNITAARAKAKEHKNEFYLKISKASLPWDPMVRLQSKKK